MSQNQKLIPIVPFTGKRLRARRVDEEFFARFVSDTALEEAAWRVNVTHGGAVANSYGYKAETEGVLAISNPQGIVCYWTVRVPANKVSDRKVAEACVPGLGDIFDSRCGTERQRLAQEKAVRVFNEHVPAMLVIALASRHEDPS